MNLPNYLASAIVLLLLDILWITYFMGPRYKNMISSIQSSPMKIKISYAIFAYILMISGLYLFVLKNINLEQSIYKKFIDTLFYGGLFGLIIYGVYNFTAAAVITNWSPKIAAFDILWGAFVYFIAAFIGSLVK